MESLYNSLVGQTFTGKYIGLQPDDKLGPRAVFEVNEHGNDEIHNITEQLKMYTSGKPEVGFVFIYNCS